MALSNPLQDVTGGDPGLARHLADSLRTLQRHSPDQEFTKLIDDVLSGRAQLRDVVRTVAFGRVLDPLVGKFAEKYNELDGDSRAALAAEGELQTVEFEGRRLPSRITTTYRRRRRCADTAPHSVFRVVDDVGRLPPSVRLETRTTDGHEPGPRLTLAAALPAVCVVHGQPATTTTTAWIRPHTQVTVDLPRGAWSYFQGVSPFWQAMENLVRRLREEPAVRTEWPLCSRCAGGLFRRRLLAGNPRDRGRTRLRRNDHSGVCRDPRPRRHSCLRRRLVRDRPVVPSPTPRGPSGSCTPPRHPTAPL